MPAPNAKINLLPVDPFEDSFLGRFLKWALSVGRYIVIATELIVILSFLARFKLDRDLSDLNEALAQTQVVLDSYGQLEADYKAAAARLGAIEELGRQRLGPEAQLQRLTAVTPVDVYFTGIGLSPEMIELQGNTLSERGLIVLLRALRVSDNFNQVAVNQISSGGQEQAGITFMMTAKLPAAVKK